MSRKNLVDGSTAFKARDFGQAEDLFRRAAARDPEGLTLEGRTAQIFLARTLHQRFSADRQNKEWAERALAEYNTAIPQALREYADAKAAYDANSGDAAEQKRYFSALSAVNSTASAITSLNDALGQGDASKQWLQKVSADEQFPPTARARALVSLGLEFNTCAADITNNEKVRKTVKVDGKDVFQFVKPENPDDLNKLRNCVTEGEKIFNQAFLLESDYVKNAPSLDVTTLNDDQLSILEETILPFESARSYRASIGVQAARLAEIDGASDLAAKKAEADRRRADSDQLKKVAADVKAEKERRVAAAKAAATEALQQQGNANAAQ